MESSSLLQRRRNFVAPKLRIDCKKAKTGWDDVTTAHCTASTTASSVRSTACSESTCLPEQQTSRISFLNDLESHSDAYADGAVRLYEKWIDAYQPFEQLGQGSAGVVYRACRKSDKQVVAVKIMRMNNDEDLIANVEQEFDILRSIQHPCIIKALELVRFPLGAALVMDYFPGCNLKCAVRQTAARRMPELTAQQIFSMLIQAIEYLHRNDIIHRDIKAQNILVSPELDDLRLIDFNVAKSFKEGALTMTGTIDYMPPEVLLGESPSAAGDIWAAGLCLYFMLSGKMPLDRKNFRSRYAFGLELSGTQVQLPSTISASVSERCKTVLSSCLQADPRVRAQADELLTNQWML